MGSAAVSHCDLGIIPRVMKEMFTRIDAAEEGAKPQLKVSFMELYMEELKVNKLMT